MSKKDLIVIIICSFFLCLSQKQKIGPPQEFRKYSALSTIYVRNEMFHSCKKLDRLSFFSSVVVLLSLLFLQRYQVSQLVFHKMGQSQQSKPKVRPTNYYYDTTEFKNDLLEPRTNVPNEYAPDKGIHLYHFQGSLCSQKVSKFVPLLKIEPSYSSFAHFNSSKKYRASA